MEEYEPPSFETPSFGPSVTEDVEIDFDNSEINQFFDINKVNDDKESQLDKYHKAMNFNSPNLQELSKQAEIQKDKIKIEQLSFNKVVDTFSDSIFIVLDNLVDLLHKKINENPIDNKLDFCLCFMRDFMAIISEDDVILHMGVIFIFIGLFVYFVDSTDTTKRDKSLLEYIHNIKI